MDYQTHGVCSKNISFDIKDGKVYNVHFTGGSVSYTHLAQIFSNPPPAHPAMIP